MLISVLMVGLLRNYLEREARLSNTLTYTMLNLVSVPREI